MLKVKLDKMKKKVDYTGQTGVKNHKLFIKVVVILGLLLLCFIPTVSASIYTDALAFWTLNNANTNETASIDSSGNEKDLGRDSTTAEIIVDTFQGIQFNGTGGLYHTKTQDHDTYFDYGNDVTLSLKLKFNGTGTNTAGLITWSNSTAGGVWGGISLFLTTSGNIQFHINDGTVDTLEYKVDNNTWYSVIAKYSDSGNYMKLYIDGVLTNSTTTTKSPTNTTYPLRIGSVYNIDGYYFNGTIRDVGIWDKDLSESEIQIIAGTSDLFYITPLDEFNNSYVNATADINGVLYYYNSTAQAINTDINRTLGELYNITLFADNYLNLTYLNYNTSEHLYSELNYYKSRHTITAKVAPLNVTTISNFSISVGGVYQGNTTTGSYIAETTWNASSVIQIDPTGYQIDNWTTNGSTNDAHQFNLYGRNSFNIQFYNEETSELITQLVELDLISDIVGGYYNTTNGSIYASLLSPTDYVFRYSSENYTTRSYYLTITDGSYNQINLYLLNESKTNNVTAKVITTLNEKLEGATINVQRYDPDTNLYRTVERVNTNYEGIAVIHVANTEFYKFTVSYEGSTVLTTTPTYILENSITLVVDTGGDPTETFYNIGDIDYTFTYVNTSNQFRFVFNDIGSVTSQVCLKIYSTNTIIGDTLTNSSCVSTTSGTIILNVPPTNGTTYIGKALVTIGGIEYLLDTIITSFDENSGFGNEGVLIIAFLMIVFASIAIWNPFVALLLTPLPLVFGAMTHIIDVSTGIIFGVVVGVLFIAFYIGGKT